MLDGRTKGLPAGIAPLAREAVGGLGLNVLREDLSLPLAVLKRSSLEHNATWMRSFTSMTGVALAPHGKTSMSPQLFERQLADGACAITVATVQQLRVCREHGIQRVLMANQLVGRQAIAYVLDELARDPAFEFWALVDSLVLVDMLARAAQRRRVGRPLALLVECGAVGGRTGCRTIDEALAVARRVKAAEPWLTLAGVEGYEGSVPGSTPVERDANIARFVEFIGDVARRVANENLFATDSVMLTAGGSAYFDMVTALPRELGDRKTRIVLRSGCYLTHDSDAYAKAAARMRERMPAIATLGEGLRDAIELWSYVQSRPEPELAILTMGKRDVAHDVHLPYPRVSYRPGRDARPVALADDFAIRALNDQHAYLVTPGASDLAVGDMVGCAISHPCTTFDKWRFMPIVDDDYNVVDAITTHF
ncbi:MAG TPA: amino acid deaminase [Casimicrobiaceae bacterium]|nr:amino acid deaminase [Casimicrobiaceae bacterium]